MSEQYVGTKRKNLYSNRNKRPGTLAVRQDQQSPESFRIACKGERSANLPLATSAWLDHPMTRSPDDPMARTIFHVDMDAFFVSVEELYDPSLKGKPVVVGGQRDERGVVSAASYAARKFGVHSAMPLRTAAKLCPQAIFVNGHPERYREYSGRVHEVLGHFSPLVEMASVDEAYLDMTGTERLHGPPLRCAHRLHDEMKSKTQLNCSIGIGTFAAYREGLIRKS